MRFRCHLALMTAVTGLMGNPSAAQDPPSPETDGGKPPIEISGFVDTYFEYNFNRPPKYVEVEGEGQVRVDPQNTYRNFDFRHNEFALNLVEVVIQRAPAPVGFRVDLNYGKTTDWVHSAEPGGADTYKLFQQAYLTVPVRLSGTPGTLDVGKFVTSAGAEVIETKDNWNYTRGLLFSWAIPYYHAGLRYSQPLSDGSTVGLQILNGWNAVEDNNDSLSGAVTYSRPLGSRSSFVLNYIGGPERTGISGDWRHLVDTTVTVGVTDSLSFMLNADYAWEDRQEGDVRWKGIAAYARQALSEDSTAVIRAEWFDDEDGAATGTAQDLHEITLTYEKRPMEGLLTRLEFRWDKSDEDVFLDSDGGMKDSQSTLLAGAVYSF